MKPQVVYDVRLWPADSPKTPLSAVLTYSSSDPYAVALLFTQGRTVTAEYVFARDLLAEGLRAPAGQGDVLVAPHEELGDIYLAITLTPASGYPFLLYAVRELVVDFIDQTFRLVPHGREQVDVDAAIATILGEVTS
ncbi:SsgA family sporulation/cell division regulator [Streptosporangium sp. NPDC050855]|uniref:SsgA family sporulation/cell division regulator n=1 Tax=Streptosporangium sp. NPDC050855 TaxID=3366194 RepID=UPI003790DE66